MKEFTFPETVNTPAEFEAKRHHYIQMGYNVVERDNALFLGDGTPLVNLDNKYSNSTQKRPHIKFVREKNTVSHSDIIPKLFGIYLLGDAICYFILSWFVAYIVYFVFSFGELFFDMFAGGPSVDTMFSKPAGSFALEMGMNGWGLTLITVWTIIWIYGITVYFKKQTHN